MGIIFSFSSRSAGEYLSLVLAVCALACMGVYYSHESALVAVNTTVIAYLAGITVANVAYFALDVRSRVDVAGLIELVGVALAVLCLMTYLLDGIANLADLLNGIQISSGGAGDVTTIFALIGLMAALGLGQIAVCFMRRGEAQV